MRLPASIALALLLCFQGRAATIYFDIADFTTVPSAYRTLKITPATMPSVSGTNIIVKDSRSQITTGFGRVSFTNVVAGTYDVAFTGPNATTSFQITVTNTSATLNAKDIISVETNSVYGLNAYSMASSDARYLQGVWTNGVGVATNPVINIIVGSNQVVVATNNSVAGRTDVHISGAVVGGGSGEANTSSNTGDGVGIANAKSGVDLPFKSFKSGNNLITVETNATNITHTADTTPEFLGLNTTLGLTNTGRITQLETNGVVRWGDRAESMAVTNPYIGTAFSALAVRRADNLAYGSWMAHTLQAWTGTNANGLPDANTHRKVMIDPGGPNNVGLASDTFLGWADGATDAGGTKDLALHRSAAGNLMLSASSAAVPTGTLHTSNGYFRGALTGEMFTATSATVGSLTASRPVLSDGSKALASGQIDLSSADHVTGTLADGSVAATLERKGHVAASNYVSRTELSGSNYVARAELAGSNYTSRAEIAGSNFVGVASALQGDIAYHNGTSWTRLAKGTAGQVLEMNAGATAPEWDTDDTGAGGTEIRFQTNTVTVGSQTNLNILWNASDISILSTNVTGSADYYFFLPSGITRDSEWDTAGEVETAWGSVNILLETEIDASSELRALVDDESGTGALLFAGGNIEAGTATTPSTGDNDTSIATTAFVSATLVSSNYQTRAVYREIWIPAGAMTPAAVNGPSTNTFAPSGADGATIDVFDFDDTTPETNFFTISMPDAWDRGTIKAKYHWTATTGTAADGVTWGIAAGAASDDDPFGAILGTRVTLVDDYIASGDLHVSAATGAITVGGSPALHDMVLFQIVRPNDVGDDKTGDAKLIGVKIQYRESSTDVASW